MSPETRTEDANWAQPLPDGPAVALDGVTVRANRVPLVSDVDWRVEYGQHWVMLGRNGAGKTTVLSVAGGQRFPSSGTATVLGHRMGRVDLRDLRSYIGLVTTKQRLLDEESATAHTVVLTGYTGTVLPLWERYDEAVHERARKYLELLGCAALADRSIRVCSQGERARIRVARALMAEPKLLLLDEPFAGLDMPAREDLLEALHTLMRSRPWLATVTVTHHLEEIPVTATHALLLRHGEVVTAGSLDNCLTSANLSDCYERQLAVHQVNGRWLAQASTATA